MESDLLLINTQPAQRSISQAFEPRELLSIVKTLLFPRKYSCRSEARRMRHSLSADHFQDPCHLSLNDLEQIDVRNADYVPTPEQLEQSRRNQLESMAMTAGWSEPGLSSSNSGNHRNLNNFHLWRHQLRSQPSDGRLDQRVGAAGRSVLDRQAWASLDIVGLTSDDSYDDARALRRLRPKYCYSSIDDLRVSQNTHEMNRTMAAASPGAMFVSSTRTGICSIVSECHGFCYSTPVNVRISTYPVPDGQSREGKVCHPDRPLQKKTFSKDTVLNGWSKLRMVCSTWMNLPPSVPFYRMLKLKVDDLVVCANSGDLLLEGSHVRSNYQYIQTKSSSLCSHISVIYREPHSGVLYMLTSRNWPRNLSTKGKKDASLFDLDTFENIDGVQMHPLAEYVDIQRRRGVYFVYRRLQYDKRKLDWNERETIGTALYQWYKSHQGCPFPEPMELCQRLRETRRIQFTGGMSSKGHKLLGSKAYTSSQVSMEALRHAGVLSPDLQSHDPFFSVPGYFEMKCIDHAPSAAGAFPQNFSAMMLITGQMSSRPTQDMPATGVSLTRPLSYAAV